MGVVTNPHVCGVPIGSASDLAGTAAQLTGSTTWNPPFLTAGDEQLMTMAVPGAAMGDAVAAVSISIDLLGTNLGGYVSAPNTVTVTHKNDTEGDLDLGSGTVRVWVNKSF